MYGLKSRASQVQRLSQSYQNFDLPNIDQETVRKKKISKEAIFKTILQLEEGDFENGIVKRVQNRNTASGLSETLFHDRIFWLSSQQVESKDYDVRVTDLLNARNN